MFGTPSAACWFVPCWSISLESLVPLCPLVCCRGHRVQFQVWLSECPKLGDLYSPAFPIGKPSRNTVSQGTRGVIHLHGYGLQVAPGAAEEWVCCFITETDNSCKVCCRDEQDRCIPYVDANDQFLFLRKGKPCTVGFCDTNVSFPRCQRTVCSASMAGVSESSVSRTVLVKRSQSLTCWAGRYCVSTSLQGKY